MLTRVVETVCAWTLCLYLLTMLHGCGEAPVEPLVYKLDEELVSLVVGLTELHWAETFPAADIQPFKVTLVGMEHPKLRSLGVTYMKEVPPAIYVYYKPEEDRSTCFWPRNVLGHEFLHTLCLDTHTGTLGENHFHITPKVWKIWQGFEVEDLNDTVEDRIADSVSDYCNNKWEQ